MIRMPSLGDEFGRYRLLRELGHGGMGIVYVAHDAVLDREVALKIIAPQLAGDEAYRVRFKREAGALSKMDSPHVVAVHDHGEQDGCLYLVTQLVPDGDLLQHLQRAGALAPTAAVDVVMQVLDGLADAHRAGIVHRDVKPSNVLLRRRDGHLDAFLCDFGVASTPGEQVTHTGALVGSFPYMAPERHQGEPAGVRGDIYSAGCLLWQVLTGTAPYGGTEVEIALAHLQAPIPQLPGGTEFADVVNAVLSRALAKDPADRFASARAMRGDLQAAIATGGPAHVDLPAHTQIRHSVLPGVAAARQPDTLAPPQRRRRAAVVASAAVVALVAVTTTIVVAATGGDAPASDVVDVADTAVVSTSPLDATTSTSESPDAVDEPRGTGTATPRGRRSDGSKVPRSAEQTDRADTAPQADPPAANQQPSPRGDQSGNGGKTGTGDNGGENSGGGKGNGGNDGGNNGGNDEGGPKPTKPSQSTSPQPVPRQDFQCWGGGFAASLDECGHPTGLTGMRWVFPGYSGCTQVTPSAPRVAKLVCPGKTKYGPIEVSFTQFSSVPAALKALRDQSGRAGSPWRGGWGYQFSQQHPDWKVKYIRTFLYDDEPMSVRIEAANEKARGVALSRISYRPPAQLRGVRR